MKWLSGILSALCLGFAAPALATTCSSLPYTLTNGNTADATQVMANFNSLLTCLNLNVAPLASPTFTGTVNGANSFWSGTLGVNGNSTLSGGASVSTQLVSTIGTAAAGGAYFIMRPTDLGIGKPELYFNKALGNNLLWELDSYDSSTNQTAQLNINLAQVGVAGTFTSVGMLTASTGFTLTSGPMNLPAASLVNSYLDTVNSAPATCGSATLSCQVTYNAQGRVTSGSAVTIQPDTTSVSTTSGYWKTPQGVVVQWYHYDTGGNNWGGGPTSITFPYTPTNGCFAYSAVTDNQGGVASPWYALQVTSAPGGHSVSVQAVGFQSGSHNAIEGFYVTAYCY